MSLPAFVRSVVAAGLGSLVWGGGEAALAQTATATVTYEVREISQVSLSGDPQPLLVAPSTAGPAKAEVVGGGVILSITTNAPGWKVTAGLDAAMPAGTTLAVDVPAPGGSASAGAVTLGTAARDLVTGFGGVHAAVGLSYRLSATLDAGVVPQGSRTTTLTVVAGT